MPEKQDLPDWAEYIGREISYTGPGGEISGVFNEPTPGKTTTKIRPFVHREADGRLVYEKKDSIQFSLGYLGDQYVHTVIPHKDGYLVFQPYPTYMI